MSGSRWTRGSAQYASAHRGDEHGYRAMARNEGKPADQAQPRKDFQQLRYLGPRYATSDTPASQWWTVHAETQRAFLRLEMRADPGRESVAARRTPPRPRCSVSNLLIAYPRQLLGR